MNLTQFSKFQTIAKAHQGVFSLNELKNFINAPNKVQFYREVKKLEEEKIIGRLGRGMYVTAGGNLDVVSQKISPESYISFGNVLAKNLLIGTIPRWGVMAVKLGKSRVYKGSWGTIIQLGIKPELFFGYKIENGIAYADSEKAFLDTLYFYQKGQRFYFNVYSDIDIYMLDLKKVREYLKEYRNPLFVQFVEGVIRAGN